VIWGSDREKFGLSREPSVVVNPSASTTYKLYSTNEHGRSTAKVTIAVK
jgi:hypothetical protein